MQTSYHECDTSCPGVARAATHLQDIFVHVVEDDELCGEKSKREVEEETLRENLEILIAPLGMNVVQAVQCRVMRPLVNQTCET